MRKFTAYFIVISFYIFVTLAFSQTYPEGMISYWKFDEGDGSIASDSVGAYDGDIHGPTYSSGKVRGALLFDGIDDYVEIPDLNFPTPVPFSIEAWVHPTAENVVRVIFDREHGELHSQRDYCFWIRGINEDNKVRLRIYHIEEGDLVSRGVESSEPIPTNVWTHIAATYDGYESKMYINGVYDNTGEHPPETTNDNGGPSYIGALKFRNQHFFVGLIDELAIYDRVLTTEEILQHYENGLIGLGYEIMVPAFECTGFEPPMNMGPVTVKKNKVLPLKSTILYNDVYVTDTDVVAPPVIQVMYSSGVGEAIDVTDDALAAGLGTDGNQFVFDGTWWHFNLKTKNYTAPGTYQVTMKSGDGTEYTIDPACAAEFVIE